MAKRSFKRRREQRKSKMRWPSTRSGWLRRWRHSLGILRDQAEELWENHEIYSTWIDTIKSNPNIDRSNEFFHFIQDSYLRSTLLRLRTFDDPDLRSHSLYNLIEEIRENNSELTKEWFLARYRNVERWIGEEDFQSDWGGRSCIGKRLLQADSRKIRETCKKARVIVNKQLAHIGRRKPRIQLNSSELKSSINEIYGLISKYNALLNNASWGTPDLLDWTEVFDVPWHDSSE